MPRSEPTYTTVAAAKLRAAAVFGADWPHLLVLAEDLEHQEHVYVRRQGLKAFQRARSFIRRAIDATRTAKNLAAAGLAPFEPRVGDSPTGNLALVPSLLDEAYERLNMAAAAYPDAKSLRPIDGLRRKRRDLMRAALRVGIDRGPAAWAHALIALRIDKPIREPTRADLAKGGQSWSAEDWQGNQWRVRITERGKDLKAVGARQRSSGGRPPRARGSLTDRRRRP